MTITTAQLVSGAGAAKAPAPRAPAVPQASAEAAQGPPPPSSVESRVAAYLAAMRIGDDRLCRAVAIAVAEWFAGTEPAFEDVLPVVERALAGGGAGGRAPHRARLKGALGADAARSLTPPRRSGRMPPQDCAGVSVSGILGALRGWRPHTG